MLARAIVAAVPAFAIFALMVLLFWRMSKEQK